MPTTRSSSKRGTESAAPVASKKVKVEKSKAKAEKPKAANAKKSTKTAENVKAVEVTKSEDEIPEPKKKREVATKGKNTEVTEDETTKTVKETKAESKGKKAETEKNTQEANNSEIEAKSIYEFTVNNIKGEPVLLEKYKGNVCIIVNVASRCGHTKSNYEQFVKLYEDYGETKGLKILAFPCNQFGGQEPGDADKICKFAESRNVKFDMFEKLNVNGPKAHPLWNFLKSKLKGPQGKDIKWNFTKFIINKDGEPVERFTPATKPLTLVDTLEKYW